MHNRVVFQRFWGCLFFRFAILYWGGGSEFDDSLLSLQNYATLNCDRIHCYTTDI